MNILLDYSSLAILFTVILILIYGLIVVHDIPYEIALKRNHPHVDAIHVAGWISLFFLHVMWPLLWVWAMLYDGKKQQFFGQQQSLPTQQYLDLDARIESLEKVIKG